jgi:sugar (pentulose or hexulose) kinase
MAEPKQDAVLALDLGSTHLKVALFDMAVQQRAFCSVPAVCEFGPGGQVELPVSDFVAAMGEIIRGCLAQAPGTILRAVAITSQAQTFTLTDETGQPLIPFISWQDNRGGPASAALKAAEGMAEFQRHSSFGTPLPSLQISQLRRLRDESPDLLRTARRVLSLPTFLVQALAGEAAIDNNLAAMTGLFSLELNDWWPAALSAAGVGHSKMPRLVPIGASAGQTTTRAAAFGLPAGIPVILAGNDQTAGALGAGIQEKDALLLTLGTAQVAYATTPRLADPAPGLIRGPFPGGLAYRMAADSCGGNLITWAQAVIAGAATDARFFELAASAAPGCHGLCFEPDLTACAGAWRNLGLHHHPAELARSILEALCASMERMVHQLGVGLPPPGGHVLAAGGGSASALWLEMLTGRLGCEVRRTCRTALDGAAALAFDSLR